MTEFWKSNERHYCTVCKCWMDAKQASIRTHENGARHQEEYIKHQKQVREAKASATKAVSKEEAMWAELDAKAQASYALDIAAAGGKPVVPAPMAMPAAVAGAHAQPILPLAGSAAAGAIRPSRGSEAKRKETASPWVATVDASTGATYYYNANTLATTWDKPAELKEQERATTMDAADGKTEGKGKRKVATGGGGEEAAGDKASRAAEGEAAPDAKKQKTSSSALAAAATSAAAIPAPTYEIDEATGMGKWLEQASAPEPTPADQLAQLTRPRMTPFGMVTPDAPPPPAAAIAAAEAKKAAPIPGRYNNLAADDDDDADDEGPTVDMAQQLRNQFGPSKLVHARSSAYEAGADLLQEDDPNAAPTVVSFKKKTKRQARLPTPATNK